MSKGINYINLIIKNSVDDYNSTENSYTLGTSKEFKSWRLTRRNTCGQLLTNTGRRVVVSERKNVSHKKKITQ